MQTLPAFVSISQLIVILVIVALLFGTKRIRTLGEDVGHAIKGLRNGIKSEDLNDE